MATSIQLSGELGSRLEALAARSGRTKASQLREIVENGIAEMEEYCLASATLDRVRSGREEVFSSDALRKDLGLEG